MPRQRGDQWNASANSRIGIVVQANGSRNPDELRNCGDILAGFAPLTLFVWFTAPPLESKGAILGHSVMLLTHVFVIALAGVIANRRLLGLLRKMSGSDNVARAVLFSWLAGNLFLGAQIAWNLRPFIGSPRLAIEFLRSDPLRGNFYEAVWRALRHLFF